MFSDDVKSKTKLGSNADLPLAPAGKSSSATPSPRGSAPKTPECHTDSILLTQNQRKLNFIDLFAGCGGLSEGFLQTGKYKALAHVEWELPMVKTLHERLVDRWNHSEEEAKKLTKSEALLTEIVELLKNK